MIFQLKALPLKSFSYEIYFYLRSLNKKKRKGLILKLKDDKQKIGWGEIAPLPHFSLESFSEAKEQLFQQIRHFKKGKGLLSFLFPSVHFGIESAFLELISPIDSPKQKVNRLFSGSPKEMVKKAKACTHSTIKIKIGHLSLKEAIKTTSAILSSLPQNSSIRIDGNQKYSLQEALSFAKAFPANTFEYFEELLKNPHEYPHFPYAIALDETLRGAPLSAYLNHPFLRAFIVKPTLMGGMTKLFSLYSKAVQKGIAFILSSSYESELGLSLIAKLGKRLKLPPLCMGLRTYQLFKEPFFKYKILEEQGNIIFPKIWTTNKWILIDHGSF